MTPTTTLSEEEVRKLILGLPIFDEYVKYTAENMKAGFKRLKAGTTPSGKEIRISCHMKDFMVQVKFFNWKDEEPDWAKSPPSKRVLTDIANSLAVSFHIPRYKEFSDKVSKACAGACYHLHNVLHSEIVRHVPELMVRAREVHACLLVYVNSGAINKKKDTHKKRVHMTRLKKALLAGIKSGLDKQDILDALDEAIVSSIHNA
jgi:hypothetical protein